MPLHAPPRARPASARNRTGSLPSKAGRAEDVLLSWGAFDLSSKHEVSVLEESARDGQAPARKNWRPASARGATGRVHAGRASPSSLSATPRPPPGPSSHRQKADSRPASARVYRESQASNSHLDAKASRPPSAPARAKTHTADDKGFSGSASCRRRRRKELSDNEPIDDVWSLLHHFGRPPESARRERSFNVVNKTSDSQQGGLSIGACLPVAWTPPLTPVDRDGELDEATFKRAEKLTHVRLPPQRRFIHCQLKAAPEEPAGDQQEDDVESLGPGSFRRNPSSLSEKIAKCGDKSDRLKEGGKKGQYGSKHKSLFDKDEKLVGMHVKSANLKKGETKVVYSQNYIASKELEEDEIERKGTGTVLEWDPDGLMTDVQWENGTTEYCCTGFNRLYCLALKLVVDEETGATHALGWEDPGKKMINMMASYPDWLVLGAQENPFPSQEDELGQGVSRVPKTSVFRVIKDVWDELSTQRRLQKLKAKSMQEGKDTHVFDKALIQSHKNVRRLEKDQEIMSDWIVSNINGIEIRVPPSSLAPTAPALVTCDTSKRPSLVQKVYEQVRRDAEKARRQARLEAEAEKERIRLERKAFRVSKRGDPGGHKAKELQEAAAQNKRKQSRLHMDPWEAVLTATEEELDVIFNDTFTLYDFDFSGTLDLAEFEEAMESMGVKGESEALQALVVAMDKDGNGTLDVQEFKTLAKQLIATAKEFKDDVNKKKQLQALNRRRKAAGQAPLVRLPEKKGGKNDVESKAAVDKDNQPASSLIQGLMRDQFEPKPPEPEQPPTVQRQKTGKALWKEVFATTVVPQSLWGGGGGMVPSPKRIYSGRL